MASSAVSCVPAAESAKIRELICQFKADKIKVNTAMYGIMEILMRHDGAIQRVFRPHQVAVHFNNRDGKLITASGVELRAKRLDGVGFNKKLFEQGAWCIEDNPLTREIAKKALEHFKTDKRFATFHENEIEVGSVGAGHTNHLVASVIDEALCNDPDIAVNGRYSKAHWFAKHHDMEAAAAGVTWWTIKWPIVDEHPEIPDIFQAGLNSQQNVGEGDHR